MKTRLLFFVYLISTSVGLGQTIRYVSPAGPNINPAAATSWATSTTDLQGAINASASGDQVWVAAGTYKPTTTTGPDSRTISFTLKEGVAVYGGFAGVETTLSQRPAVNPNTGQPSSTTLSGDVGASGDDSDNSYHVVSNPVSLVGSGTLDGFVITGGNATGSGRYSYGGGMDLPTVTSQAKPFTATISNCLFYRNKATLGGALFMSSGFRNSINTPAILNCMFLENTANTGGALYNNNGDSYQLTGCTFEKNTAVSGGVITCVNSGSFSSTLTFVNTIFRQNSATNGGVLYGTTVRGSVYFRCFNTLFDSNSAVSGGVAYEAGAFGLVLTYLVNCTFWNNSASEQGGVLCAVSQYTQNRLINCIVWDNGGKNTFANQPSIDAINSLFEPTVTGYTSNPGNLTVTVSPFASTTSLQLSLCSPAINAGSNSAIASLSLTTDLAGNPRFHNNGTVDMGAYEYQGDAPASVGIAAQPAASTVCQGQLVRVPVEATGTVSGYQWYQNGGVLTGQTSATLTLAASTTAQTGAYSVAVLGQCNSVTSAAGSLVVNPAPTRLTVSSGTLTCAQTSLTLTASATDASTFALSNGQQSASGQFVVSQPGTYTVSASAASGCSSATTTAVISDTVAPEAPALTSASQTVYTSSLPLSLTAYVVSSGMNPLLFSGAGGLLATPVVSVSAAGEQVYSVRQRGTNGCLSAPSAFTLLAVPLLATEPVVSAITILPTPNPVTTAWLRATVRGAAGQSLHVQLLTLQGAVVHTQHWPAAEADQCIEWSLPQHAAGTYLLRAQVNDQVQTVKLVVE